MQSRYAKMTERVEGQGTIYDRDHPGAAVAYRLTISQMILVTENHASGGQREGARGTDVRGVVFLPDVARYFGRPVTLRLEDGRELAVLVTDAAGTVRANRDTYSAAACKARQAGARQRQRPKPKEPR